MSYKVEYMYTVSPKRKYTHLSSRVPKTEGGQMKSSVASPNFPLASLDFEYLALPQVYTFFRWRLQGKSSRPYGKLKLTYILYACIIIDHFWKILPAQHSLDLQYPLIKQMEKFIQIHCLGYPLFESGGSGVGFKSNEIGKLSPTMEQNFSMLPYTSFQNSFVVENRV